MTPEPEKQNMPAIGRTLSDAGIRRTAFVFVLALFVFECYVVDVDYTGPLARLFDGETQFFFVLTLISILVSFYVFFYFIAFALAARWPYKAATFLIFASAAIVEYGYQHALGRFSEKLDIETAVATTATQKLESIQMYLSYSALIPCVAFLVLLLFIRAKKPRGIRPFLLVNALLIGSFAAFSFLSPQRFPTISTAAFYRTGVEFLLYGPVANGKWAGSITGIKMVRREAPKPSLPNDYRPHNNIVLVVDESVMGSHLSLNGYGRETTPFLDRLAAEKKLTNWGIAAAASTGSRFTYNSIITGLTPDDFPDTTEYKVNTFPTIFQFAKAMKYTTYFFDGQMNGYWGGIADDKRFIDHWLGVLEISDGQRFEKWDLDNLLARKVSGIVSASTGNFIFIFKHGSHIPYQMNFPPDQEIWKPSYTTENKFDIPSGSQLPEVVNAYDNSIHYNIDSFFKNLLGNSGQAPNNTVIIYTGDHGQTLYANGKASHGGTTKGEATVPLFIIGEVKAKVDTSYRASHCNIFPTILDLFEYPAELRERRLAPSLLTARSADSRARFFNPAYGDKVPFD